MEEADQAEQEDEEEDQAEGQEEDEEDSRGIHHVKPRYLRGTPMP